MVVDEPGGGDAGEVVGRAGAGQHLGRNGRTKWTGVAGGNAEVVVGRAGSWCRGVGTVHPLTVQRGTGLTGGRTIGWSIEVSTRAAEGVVGRAAGNVGGVGGRTADAGVDQIADIVVVPANAAECDQVAADIIFAGRPEIVCVTAERAVSNTSVSVQVVGSVRTDRAVSGRSTGRAVDRAGHASVVRQVEPISALRTSDSGAAGRAERAVGN